MPDIYDIAIIGGGINGCGIARDAAGRGLKVHLAEMGDLASGTSSWSTKLVHGGLRYLEHYKLRLVREALQEREVLWGIGPHVIEPIRLVMPHHKGLRPRWMLRLGLFLYDHIGGRKLLPATRTLDLAIDPAGASLQRSRLQTGFEFSDCVVDDARLVVLNAVDAYEHGATVETRTKVVRAERDGDAWTLALAGPTGAPKGRVRARCLVNAAGPWVGDVLDEGLGLQSQAKVRLVQGSHIVTRRLFAHDRAYVLQNTDGRIVFAIPYHGDFTLIGTTDRDYQGDPAKARASEDEIAYLCKAASRYFAREVLPQDVVWSFSGVRPLYDDGVSEAKAATRDYVLELDGDGGSAPVLSVFGGKITTYRRLAEAALDRLAPYLADRPSVASARGWTAQRPLPGGELGPGGVDALAAELAAQHPYLGDGLARRLARGYGARTAALMEEAAGKADMGRHFGADLYEREVLYLMAVEWARTADDVLWRRTKLGLRMTRAESAALDAYMRAAMPTAG